MSGNNTKNRKPGTVTFTVAECGEFHSLGEYHEDIATPEEAAETYRAIPPGRMNGIPAIGIRLYTEEEPEGMQIDILSGREIHTGLIHCMPEAESCPAVWEAVRGLQRLFSENEVTDF